MTKPTEPLQPIKFFEPENFIFAFLGAISAVIVGLMMFGNPAVDSQAASTLKRNPASVAMQMDFEPLVYWSDLSSPK